MQDNGDTAETPLVTQRMLEVAILGLCLRFNYNQFDERDPVTMLIFATSSWLASRWLKYLRQRWPWLRVL